MTVNDKCYCPGCMKEIIKDEKCSCGFNESEYKIQSQWLPHGTVLHDSILIGKVIGDGGFGITYIGIDLNLQMKVAVKEFFMSGYCGRNTQVSLDVLTDGSDNAEIFETGKNKFIDEARILARFSEEPGIVTVNRFFKENNTAYIVMEYVEGESLKEYVSKNGRLSIRETLMNMLPVIDALNEMHAQHIYHRDISPDNIILTSNQGMKLLDFGSAREKIGEYKTMTVVLKKAYSPVEQYETHGNQGPWTDIYSLCATIYYCITGKTPDSAYDRFMNDAMPTVHEVEPSCDEDLSEIISTGMHVSPEDRYQSVDELNSALIEYVNNHKSEYGRNFLLFNSKSDEDEADNKNKDYFVIKKKALRLSFVIAAAIIVVIFAALGIRNVLKETDKQVIYLTYPEDASMEEIARADKAIKDRLSATIGSKNVRIKKGEQYSTVNVKIDENVYFSDEFLSKYLFRPDKLSLVYSTESIDENVIINTEDIASICQNPENESENYIELTDEAAGIVSDKIEDWIKRTKPSDSTVNNLGGTVVKYKTYDPLSNDPELNQIQTEVIPSDEIVGRCIRLMFDYDMWKNGIIKDSERSIIEVIVSGDGHKLYIPNLNDFARLKVTLENHYDQNDINLFIDAKSSFPVIWEREMNAKNNILAEGLYQRNPESLLENDAEYVDVEFRRDSDNANFGDWYNYRKFVQSIFDELEVEYAIGRLANDVYSIVIRIPNKYAGNEFYKILSSGPNSSVITLTKMGDTGDMEPLGYIKAEFIKWPVTMKDNNVYVDLTTEDEYRKLDGSKVYWNTLNSMNNYLIGEYDKAGSRLVFSQSSYASDGTIPDEIENYIELLNAVYSVNAAGYRFDYSGSIDESSETDYESLTEPVQHILTNRLKDAQVENAKNRLTETLGVEPNVEYTDTLCTVTLKQSITDNYAKNLTRIINSIIDADLFVDNDIYTLYSSKCLFRIENINDTNQANITIDDKGKDITIFFWKDNLTNEEQKIFDSQLIEIKRIIEEGNDFSGYTVEINNVE